MQACALSPESEATAFQCLFHTPGSEEKVGTTDNCKSHDDHVDEACGKKSNSSDSSVRSCTGESISFEVNALSSKSSSSNSSVVFAFRSPSPVSPFASIEPQRISPDEQTMKKTKPMRRLYKQLETTVRLSLAKPLSPIVSKNDSIDDHFKSPKPSITTNRRRASKQKMKPLITDAEEDYELIKTIIAPTTKRKRQPPKRKVLTLPKKTIKVKKGGIKRASVSKVRKAKSVRKSVANSLKKRGMVSMFDKRAKRLGPMTRAQVAMLKELYDQDVFSDSFLE